MHSVLKQPCGPLISCCLHWLLLLLVSYPYFWACQNSQWLYIAMIWETPLTCSRTHQCQGSSVRQGLTQRHPNSGHHHRSLIRPGPGRRKGAGPGRGLARDHGLPRLLQGCPRCPGAGHPQGELHHHAPRPRRLRQRAPVCGGLLLLTGCCGMHCMSLRCDFAGAVSTLPCMESVKH